MRKRAGYLPQQGRSARAKWTPARPSGKRLRVKGWSQSTRPLRRTARLAHFDEALTLTYHRLDLREQWLKPLEQCTASRIADAQPKHDWSNATLEKAVGKIFVLSHKNGFVFESISPNLGVIGIEKTYITNVLSLVPTRSQHPGKRGRKLGINKEAHRYRVTRTG